MFFTIIIVNFNYGRYIRQAIESAIAVVAPSKQIIIVDDGSTDNSRQIIREYRKKATIIFKKNGGQFSAYNSGFKASTGKWVLFLDSDDYLFPSIFQDLRPFLKRGVSKVQFRSQVIDHLGILSNKLVPNFKYNTNPQNIRKWNLTTGSYPSSWGTGNVYSSAFLKKIFPLSGFCERLGDTEPIILAPFFGAVETRRKPLAAYRIHDKNSFFKASTSSKGFLKKYLHLEQRISYRLSFAKKNKLVFLNHFPKRNILLVYQSYLAHKLFPRKSFQYKCGIRDFLSSIFVSQPFPFQRILFCYLAFIFLLFLNKSLIYRYKSFFFK